MKIHPVLLFCFLSALKDGNIGLINAKSFTGTKGQSITVLCNFPNIGNRKYFCKDRCEEIILEMYGLRLKKGRYSMEYKNTRTGSRLDVTITQLTKSDSGHYGCGLDIHLSQDPYIEFKIIVKDAPSTSNLTLRPSTTPVQSAYTRPPTTTTTQSFRRSSTTSSSSAETINQFEEQQPEITDGSSGIHVSVLPVSLIVIFVLLAVFLLFIYKWKKRGDTRLTSTDPLSSINMEPVIYENFVPVSTSGASANKAANPSSIYETLNPITMADDQTYCTLTKQI